MGLETKPTGSSTVQSQDSTDSTLYSGLRRGSSSDFTMSSRETPHAGHVDFAQSDGSSQRIPACKRFFQPPPPEESGFAKHRNMTAPEASRSSKHGNRQQVKLDRQFQKNETESTSMPSGKGDDKRDMSNLLGVRREDDRHELFFFDDKQRYDTVQNGTEVQSSQRQSGVLSHGGITVHPRPSNLSSSRDRVPTPGLGRVLGSAPTSQATQHRRNGSVLPQKRGFSTAKEGSVPRHEGIRYYDYSEGFEPSTTLAPRLSTCQTLVLDPGPVKSYHDDRSYDPIPGNSDRGSHSEYGYTQVRTRNDEYSYSHSTSRYAFASPPLQGAGGWTQRDRRVYAFRGESYHPRYPEPPRVPTQAYAYAESYEAYPQRPRFHLPLPKSRNGRNNERDYTYTQTHQEVYQGRSGYSGGRRELHGYLQGYHEADAYHGQHRDSGRYHGRFGGDGRRLKNHQAFEGGFSNENIPPTHAKRSEATLRNERPDEQRHAIGQAPRTVQSMIKNLFFRGVGQWPKGHDGPVIRVSRPTRIVAPRPVTSNITQQLAENVLSIDDDETLPAGLRNLQDDGPSGPSEDGLSDFKLLPAKLWRLQAGPSSPSECGLSDFVEAFYGKAETISGQNNESSTRPGALKGVHWARRTELRRPRLIARVDSTKRKSGNVYNYATPKNVELQEPFSPGARSPYPADTLTELEYRGVIQTQPKLDSDADSRGITKPECDMWESTKMKFGSAKEDVLAKLGIKTKRVREAEKRGYTPLTRHAKATILSSGQPGGALTEQRKNIEQWIHRKSDEEDETEVSQSPGLPDGALAEQRRTTEQWMRRATDEDNEAEELREASSRLANMTIAAGPAVASPGVRERWMHLKMRAFRPKPELRAKM